jgi:hypothetical protein
MQTVNFTFTTYILKQKFQNMYGKKCDIIIYNKSSLIKIIVHMCVTLKLGLGISCCSSKRKKEKMSIGAQISAT